MWELQQRRQRLQYASGLPPWVSKDAHMEPMHFAGERFRELAEMPYHEEEEVEPTASLEEHQIIPCQRRRRGIDEDDEYGGHYNATLPSPVVTTVTSRHVPLMTQYPLPPPAPLYRPVARSPPSAAVRRTGVSLPYVGQADSRLADEFDDMFRRQQYPYAQARDTERRPHEPWESAAVVKKARKVRSWKSPSNGCC